LKQLSLAFVQYQQDSDEIMPKALAGVATQGAWMFINGPTVTVAPGSAFDPTQGSIYSYVKSKGVYVCPDDSSGQADSYALNILCDSINLSQLTAPAATILLVEEGDGYLGGTDDANDATPANPPIGRTDIITKRHNGGAVYAMADGHAKYYINGKIPSPTDPNGDPRYQL